MVSGMPQAPHHLWWGDREVPENTTRAWAVRPARAISCSPQTFWHKGTVGWWRWCLRLIHYS
jgi:hypothetical protein